jgi:hypothetical protein
MREPIQVLFYTKPGCHLCDDVDEVLDVLAQRHPLAVQRIDITQDVELYQRYWRSIPVVIVGDTTLGAPIESRALQIAVVQAARK